MQFPMRDAMTPDQRRMNEEAAKVLIKGKFYRFNPRAVGTGIPTGGPGVCALAECAFERGWYVGFADGQHLFFGKPVDDQRVINPPQGYEDAPNLDQILEDLRDCYFNMLFIGGVDCVLDEDQSRPE